MTIKAAVYRGDKRFEVTEKQAEAPGPGEVQVDVAYCGVCGTDLHIYLGHMDQRVGFERTIGHEMSGTVAAIGEGVSGLSVGQNIVVRPLAACGDSRSHNSSFSNMEIESQFNLLLTHKD